MNSKVEERKNDLRNTTVLEVILAVIIILLCVVYIKDTEKKDLEKNYLEQVEFLKSENESLLKNIRELQKQNRELADEVERLNRKIKRYTPKRPGDKSALEQAEDKIQELEIELKKLKSKLKPEQKTGKGGIDKPSCLIENGKIEFFADIEKQGSLFQFFLTGSGKNQSKVMNVPGAPELLSKGPITIDEIQKFGKLVFQYGQNSTPSCVYFVKLDPNKWSGGELKKLERYFYKSYR